MKKRNSPSSKCEIQDSAKEAKTQFDGLLMDTQGHTLLTIDSDIGTCMIYQEGTGVTFTLVSDGSLRVDTKLVTNDLTDVHKEIVTCHHNEVDKRKSEVDALGVDLKRVMTALSSVGDPDITELTEEMQFICGAQRSHKTRLAELTLIKTIDI